MKLKRLVVLGCAVVSLLAFNVAHAVPTTIDPATYDGSGEVHIQWTGGGNIFVDVNKDNWAVFNRFASGDSLRFVMTFDTPISSFSTVFFGLSNWEPLCNVMWLEPHDVNGDVIAKVFSAGISGGETGSDAFSATSNIIRSVEMGAGGIDGGISFGPFTYDRTPVPEPSTILLLALGAAGVLAVRARRLDA